MPLGGLIGAMDAKAVELAWLRIWQVAMPDLIGMFFELKTMRFRRRMRRVKEAQLDFRGMLGE